MKRYIIETPGGRRLTIEAGSEEEAMRGAQEWHAQQSAPRVVNETTPMGTDGVSGDALRAKAAGDTRATMALPDISRAYDSAASRGDRAEAQRMAGAYVQRERRDSPITTGIGDRVRAAARGVPFLGEYLDEANARTASLMGNDYQKALDYERARDSQFDAQNPYQSMGARVAGGIAGTIAAAPVAGASVVGRTALGLGARTVPGAIARGATAGALQGAAAGYGRAGEGEDALQTAAKDAALGGAFGAAIPAALAGGKMAYERIRDAVTPADALSSVPRRAQDFLTEQLRGQRFPELQNRMRELGPNAVLADVSPEFQMIARGAAARPGSRDAIVEALTSRDQGKNARLQSAFNENLGRAAIPEDLEAGIRQTMRGVGRGYDTAFQGARRADTTPIAQAVEAKIVDARGPVRSSLENARSMLNVYGTDVLDPAPQALHGTRQALDGLIGEAERAGNKSVVQALTQVRGQVDDALAQAAPGIKAVDTRYAGLNREIDALQDGRTVFRSGPDALHPELLARRVPPAGEYGPSNEAVRLQQGARAEIDRVLGANANDVAAARNMLKGDGDWNREKLRTLFGNRADNALRALDNESAMEGTYRTVVGGSQTAPTEGFRQFLNETAQGIKAPTDASVPGLLLRGGQALLQRVSGRNNAEQANQLARSLGELSVAGGSRAEALVEALMKRQAQAQTSEQALEAFGRIGAGAGRWDDNNAIRAAVIASLLSREASRRALDNQGQAPRR